MELLTDTELRYVGVLTEVVTDRTATAPARHAAWKQLAGVFAARIPGMTYMDLRHVLIDSHTTRAIYLEADDLVSALIGCSETEDLLRHLMARGGRGEAPHNPALHNLDRFQAPCESTDTCQFVTEQVLDRDEEAYLASQSPDERGRLVQAHQLLVGASSKPLRFRVLDSRLPEQVKTDFIARHKSAMRPGPHGPVSTLDAKYQAWVDQALQLPLGVCIPPPVDPHDPPAVEAFMRLARERLDATVSGQSGAKEAILEVVGACVSNPRYGAGGVIGLHGAPGVGKTSLVREGLSRALDRPCVYLNVAGVTETGGLGGFSFTFEGARPGALAAGLIASRCMNPIFLIDEVDKCQRCVADLLCSATDGSSAAFSDRFFADIPLDLSGAAFVFCYNEMDAIDPVLRDRITEIRMTSFSPSEQVSIATDYVAPRLLGELRIDAPDVVFDDGALMHLSRRYTPHVTDGMRAIRKVMQRLLLRVNLMLVTGSPVPVGDGPCARAALRARPLRISVPLIDELLEVTALHTGHAELSMYM